MTIKINLNVNSTLVITIRARERKGKNSHDGSSFLLILNNKGRKLSHGDEQNTRASELPAVPGFLCLIPSPCPNVFPVTGLEAEVPEIQPSLRHRQEILSGDKGVQGKSSWWRASPRLAGRGERHFYLVIVKVKKEIDR